LRVEAGIDGIEDSLLDIGDVHCTNLSCGFCNETTLRRRFAGILRRLSESMARTYTARIASMPFSRTAGVLE
jgi:hypothetical protein